MDLEYAAFDGVIDLEEGSMDMMNRDEDELTIKCLT